MQFLKQLVLLEYILVTLTGEDYGFSGGCIMRMEDILGSYEYKLLFTEDKDFNPCGWVTEKITDPGHEAYGGLANRTLQVPTLYDYASINGLESLIVFNMYSSIAHNEDPNITWLSPTDEDLCTYILDEGYEYDQAMMDRLLETLYGYGYEGDTPPEIITTYFAGHDHYCHYNDNAQEWYLINFIDPWVGDIVSAFKSLGIYNTSLFTILTDHGQSNVIENDEHSIIMEDELEDVVESYGPWPFGHFDVYDFWDYLFGDDFSAYVGLNGGAGHVYLRNLDTEDWTDFPFYEDIEGVAEAIKNAWRSLGDGEKNRKIELILVRDAMGGGDGWNTPYRVFKGEGQPTVDLAEYLEMHSSEFPFINGVELITNSTSVLSGDILILPSYLDGYYVDEELENEHGSLYGHDIYVPLIFAGPPLAGRGIHRPTGSITDIAPTIASFLGFEMDDCDGKPLFNLVGQHSQR